MLLTGHTGFKGGWLSLWLQSVGSELCGLSLSPPTNPSLFVEARVGMGMQSQIGDLRDYPFVLSAIQSFRPEIVIHMAAQPIVRYSYTNTIETYAVNVLGTVHLLEAIRNTSSVRAVVNVTTDKCYENKEWLWGYREEDPLGGADPYSSSKACAELVTATYSRSFFSNSGVALASARAGNVVGGGDWSKDRLVPDILRGFEKNTPVRLRNPKHTRPWQHVLEPLSGYLLLAERLWEAPDEFTGGWNFGPLDMGVQSVEWIAASMAAKWGQGASWELDDCENPYEAQNLKLDISKARARLAWEPRWDLDEALGRIIEWHKGWLSRDDVRSLCIHQIEQYKVTRTNG